MLSAERRYQRAGMKARESYLSKLRVNFQESFSGRKQKENDDR